MENVENLINKLQSYVNRANVMLVEIELEGDIINQSWHEYSTCIISKEENNIIIFSFNLHGKRAGAFITKADNIQKYNIYDKNETPAPFLHFYMHVKGKAKEPLICEDMFKIFNKKIKLPGEFNENYLYNPNRNKGNISDKLLLEQCFNNGLFNIHQFEITPIAVKYENAYEENIELGKIREYSKENVSTLKNVINLCNKIKQLGIEVKFNEKLEDKESLSPVYATAYIPNWKLIIAPDTQDINKILSIFFQEGKRVCIISSENSFGREPYKITAYIIERKNKFYEIYREFLKRQMEESYKLMLKMQEKFNPITGKDN